LILKVKDTIEFEKYWKFRELFAGLKNTPSSRFFNMVFCLNRALCVVLIVWLKDIVLDAKTILFASLQFLVLVYLLMVRPFEATKDSIIECTNQVILMVLSALLINYNSKDDWNTSIEAIFMGLITLGVLVGFLISSFDTVKIIYLRVKSYFEKKANMTKLAKVTDDPSEIAMSRYAAPNTIKSSDITITTQNESQLSASKALAKRLYDVSYSEVRPKYPKINFELHKK
jgi:hypothetical protein